MKFLLLALLFICGIAHGGEKEGNGSGFLIFECEGSGYRISMSETLEISTWQLAMGKIANGKSCVRATLIASATGALSSDGFDLTIVGKNIRFSGQGADASLSFKAQFFDQNEIETLSCYPAHQDAQMIPFCGD